ncbi:MAG: carboxylate-amine ligase, partial [Thermoleophilia bacterium]|nr:carboxylate-amine ligase [Thermoleophilia bacterium]
MEPNFTGPSYTLGIEEELMILDPETWELANAIEGLLEDSGGADDAGDIKPELHESVLEIATRPCHDTREAGAELRGLRRQVAEVA